jgi:putative addiction module component (TIGR02574 family)
MVTGAQELLEQALALSDAERLELMAALSDSFEPTPNDLSLASKLGLESRIRQLERGEVEPVEWQQVEATVHATLAQRRFQR